MADTYFWRSWETRIDWTAHATVPQDVRTRLGASLAGPHRNRRPGRDAHRCHRWRPERRARRRTVDWFPALGA